MSLCDILVVDSAGFLKNAPLREWGQQVVTLRSVVDEIKDKATKERLQFLPYDLHFREPNTDALKTVTDFSKLTGDYPSLSATDMCVMATAYMMEAEAVGSVDHLRKEPVMNATKVRFGDNKKPTDPAAAAKGMPGFYHPKEEEEEAESDEETDGEEASEEETAERPSEQQLDSFSDFSYWREPILDLSLLTPPLPSVPDPEPPSPSIDLSVLDTYLATRSYVLGHVLGPSDVLVAESVLESNWAATESKAEEAESFPHLRRWLKHVRSFELDLDRNKEENDLKKVIELVTHSVETNAEEVVESLDDLKIKEDTSQQLDSAEDDQSLQAAEQVDQPADATAATTTESLSEEEDLEEDDDDDDDEDDEGWITPMNIKDKKRLMNGDKEDEENKRVKVACLTTDFAMQNVLKQLGLHVVSLDGLLIRETRTWILRCYGCFATTSLMHKQFCPRCGHKTLKRVSVSLNADGSKQIHISTRRCGQLTGRGKKFSLPKPKGGKHVVKPLLCEDEHMAMQRQSKLARKKTDALSEDYVAGNSPFAMNDVNSKSAMIGVPGKGKMGSLYWMKKNPNAVSRNTGNRKKKSTS